MLTFSTGSLDTFELPLKELTGNLKENVMSRMIQSENVEEASFLY